MPSPGRTLLRPEGRAPTASLRLRNSLCQSWIPWLFGEKTPEDSALYTDRRRLTSIVARSHGLPRRRSARSSRPRFVHAHSRGGPPPATRGVSAHLCGVLIRLPPLRGRTPARQSTQNTAEMGRNAERPGVTLDCGGRRSAPPGSPPSSAKYRPTIRIKSSEDWRTPKRWRAGEAAPFRAPASWSAPGLWRFVGEPEPPAANPTHESFFLYQGVRRADARLASVPNGGEGDGGHGADGTNLRRA